MTGFCTYIYRDPKTNIILYVGEGSLKRPFDHFRLKSRLGEMLRKRVREGFNPQPQIIPASSKEDCQEMEMLLIEMIGRLDLKTGPLFNLTRGGDGVVGHKMSQEALKKIGEATKRRFQDPEVKKAHKLAAVKACTPEVRAKKGAALKKVLSTPEMREKWSKVGKATQSKPELQKRHSDNTKAVWAARTPEEIARIKAKAWATRRAKNANSPT